MLGISAFVFIPLIGAILAVIFAIIARKEIRKNEDIGGSGLATAGLVLGIIGIVLPVILAAVFIPLGVVYWWPKVEARRNLLQGVDAARIYYVQNNNSYEGMTPSELENIDESVEFRTQPGVEPEVVYIQDPEEKKVTLYCHSRRDDLYKAFAYENDWEFNFELTDPERERWWDEWWSPFD